MIISPLIRMNTQTRITLHELNDLSEEIASEFFGTCCASTAWIRAMIGSRPFANRDDLNRRAEELWFALSADDWLEAFEGHPRIGDVDSLRKKFAHTKDLAAGEQSGADGAEAATLIALKHGNDEYFAKFGFIFIVCATGKTAGEMLAILQERLPHDRDGELRIAAAEQNKITLLRIEKGLSPGA